MNFADLKGLTLSDIAISFGQDEIVFVSNKGDRFKLYHSQDCCESVEIEEIVGDLKDLIGRPLIEAEVVSGSNDGSRPDAYDSYTWTFYKLGTTKGHCTIRWFGQSNGYYSEEVSFEKVK